MKRYTMGLLLVIRVGSSESEKELFFGEFFKEKIMQDGPLLVINGVMGPYKWPEINWFHWGYFNPIRGVMGLYL